MKIQIINPNASLAMTEEIGHAARRVAAQGTHIMLTGTASGPASIESAFDEALALPGLMQAVEQGRREGVHAHVVACFGDPGLQAAREVADAPVLGIAQAAMHAACLLAPRFSVITTLQRTVSTAERLARLYGFEYQCRRVHATGLPVLALEAAATDDRVFAQVRACAERAIEEDGCGALVLGCAGMAPLCARLSGVLGVPVIDGVSVAVKLAEALSGAGLSASKRGDGARPEAKPVTGIMSAFALSD
ncbi:aspartate/glutamate racemase family protein [Comamonas granuli]|uniref:aspartate/glutamate racemase family protein n=1 Tax=Comamonas granuli TaxID=290309 RepID=UPI0005A9F55F|nr:aspartate/glutamate racemase family protein [Comamonas granuli]